MRGLSIQAAWVLLLLWAAAGYAQTTPPSREVEIVRSLFDAGQYQEALKRSRDLLATQNFADLHRIDLNKYAGLSAFNLGEEATAETFFHRLLLLNPDYVLDPFAVPPATIRFFDQLKVKYAEALNVARQQIAIREEQARLQTEEQERARIAAEEQRRRVEEMSRQVNVKVIERHNFLVNFIPLGAGQFQQGRTGMGIALATSEGALAATSIIAYFALEGMFQSQKVIIDDRLGGDISFTVRSIPEQRAGEAAMWRGVKNVSGGLFYLVYAYGVVDAIVHHQSEVVRTSVEELPAPPAPTAGAPSKAFLYPRPDGLGAGFSFQF